MRPVVWGVDGSTKRVAIAEATNEQVIGVRLAEFDHKLTAGARLADIARRTRTLAMEMVPDGRPLYPLLVYVEQPMAFGRQVEPQLQYAIGAIQLGIYLGLENRYAHPVDVRMIQISEWRKLAFGPGNGNAKKETYLDLMRPLGYAGEDLDECAAWGIARAGSLLVWPPQQELAV